VGVNANSDDGEQPVEILRVDPRIEAAQVERLRRLRAGRDNAAVEARLAAVREAAHGTDNLLPPMREALRARATVGEVCGVLRREFGEYDHVRAAGG
jgi:methylmalonyl-CoA mutase N-terminal domain/subunit